MDSAITRSRGRTSLWSSIALVLVAGGAALAWWAASGDNGRFILLLPAVLMFLAAVPCVMAARSPAGHAGCPHCGSAVAADPGDLERAVHCESCDGYARVVDGRLARLPPDWVDAEAQFAARVPSGGIRWPGCAMCGAEPTGTRVHVHHLSSGEANMLLNAATLMAGALVVNDKTAELTVPYCDIHDDCVELDWEKRGLIIRFRALRVWEEFSALNPAAE